VGFVDVPPVYPARVRTTPARLPNWESGPQNHPNAKVAVSISAGMLLSIGGMLFFDAADCCAIVFPPSLINRNEVKAVIARMIVSRRMFAPPFRIINIINYCEGSVNPLNSVKMGYN